MSQVSEKDVEAIRQWIDKESHLPKSFDDNMIRRFIFSCHSSLENTKKCIEKFCISRATMNEIFTDRDPLSTGIKTALLNSCVTSYKSGVDEILIHKLISTDNFEFYTQLKSFMIRSDIWISLPKDVLAENHVAVLDIKEYTLTLVAKVNIFYFQKFLLFLLEALPVRLKQVHVLNCPSYYEYLYGLVKGVLPQEVRDMIKFHTDHMSLHNFIDKKYLPLEYDGEAGSMMEQNEFWINDINNRRNFFLDDNLWKADISKRAKNGTIDTTMNGSFRSLALD